MNRMKHPIHGEAVAKPPPATMTAIDGQKLDDALTELLGQLAAAHAQPPYTAEQFRHELAGALMRKAVAHGFDLGAASQLGTTVTEAAAMLDLAEARGAARERGKIGAKMAIAGSIILIGGELAEVVGRVGTETIQIQYLKNGTRSHDIEADTICQSWRPATFDETIGLRRSRTTKPARKPARRR